MRVMRDRDGRKEKGSGMGSPYDTTFCFFIVPICREELSCAFVLKVVDFTSCRRTDPSIDGIPCLVPNLTGYRELLLAPDTW